MVALRDLQHVSDLACKWIVERAPAWERERPEWYTKEWKEAVRSRSRLLGEGSVVALAAINRWAGPGEPAEPGCFLPDLAEPDGLMALTHGGRVIADYTNNGEAFA
eukprot:1032123-Prymnesium_polylepis.3